MYYKIGKIKIRKSAVKSACDGIDKMLDKTEDLVLKIGCTILRVK